MQRTILSSVGWLAVAVAAVVAFVAVGAQPVAAASHQAQYSVIYLNVDGATDSAQAVSDAARTTSAANCEKYVVELAANSSDAVILTAASNLVVQLF